MPIITTLPGEEKTENIIILNLQGAGEKKNKKPKKTKPHLRLLPPRSH